MEKVTMEHLAPYLPYELLCTANNGCFKSHPLSGLIFDHAVFDFEDGEQDFYLEDFKPLLIPLSELTVQFLVDGVEDVTNYLSKNDIKKIVDEYQFGQMYYILYGQFQRLVSWHFDVFGLIELGLAENKLK